VPDLKTLIRPNPPGRKKATRGDSDGRGDDGAFAFAPRGAIDAFALARRSEGDVMELCSHPL
jgi:hypothetical protein